MNVLTETSMRQRTRSSITSSKGCHSLAPEVCIWAEQATPILFMASDEASYITGTVLPGGGGNLG